MNFIRSTVICAAALSMLWIPDGAQAQNLTDKQGRKTGHWLVTWPNGNKQYEAEFAEGNPVGLMKRYDQEGRLTAEMLFAEKGRRCDAILYYPEGKKAAEGIFINKDKDSVWNYYAEDDGAIRIRESWKKGVMDGTVISYYPNGQISEITEWISGVKEGKWEQFFDNGEKKLSGTYVAGLRNGPYTAYFPDGKIELEGQYLNDLFHASWKYYDENGEVILTLEYDRGKILNKDELVGKDEELLKKIEDNTGNIPDPALGEF